MLKHPSKRYSPWTDPDNLFLKKYYKSFSNSQLAVSLNRTTDAVRKQLNKFNVSRTKTEKKTINGAVVSIKVKNENVTDDFWANIVNAKKKKDEKIKESISIYRKDKRLRKEKKWADSYIDEDKPKPEPKPMKPKMRIHLGGLKNTYLFVDHDKTPEELKEIIARYKKHLGLL